MITGMGGKAVQLEIIGHSFEETDRLANQIKEIMERVPGAVDVSISREFNRPELRIEVDREKIGSLGLTMDVIANSLQAYIAGSVATKYREKGETYDINLRLEEENRKRIEDIESLPLIAETTQFISAQAPVSAKQLEIESIPPVSLTTLKIIRLSNVAKIYEVKAPVSIERQNRERVVRVECNTYKRSSGRVIEDIRKALGNIATPKDIMVNFGGEAEEQQKAFRDLGLLLILGIILVYMIMAAQFESLFDPFIIMFSIPFTFIGVILGFLLTGMTLNVVSFLGVIMLMGIVVNNAIVLIIYIIKIGRAHV
jgi:HAE1 family hydrophobic/amphiphilic exporter-1